MQSALSCPSVLSANFVPSAQVKIEPGVENDAKVKYSSEKYSSEVRVWLINALARNKTNCRLEFNEQTLEILSKNRSLSRQWSSDRRTRMRYFGIWGFGTTANRNVAVNMLRFTLRPRMIHMSTQSSGRFEGYLILRSQIQDEALTELLELLRLGFGFSEFDSFMDESSISCIERVNGGSYPIGDWEHARNRNIKLCFERKQKESLDQRRRQIVLQETGMEFSTGNMLAVYYDRENLRLESTRVHTLLVMIWQHMSLLRNEIQQNTTENQYSVQTHSLLAQGQSLAAQALNVSYTLIPTPPPVPRAGAAAAVPAPAPPPAPPSAPPPAPAQPLAFSEFVPPPPPDGPNVSDAAAPDANPVPVPLERANSPLRINTGRNRFGRVFASRRGFMPLRSVRAQTRRVVNAHASYVAAQPSQLLIRRNNESSVPVLAPVDIPGTFTSPPTPQRPRHTPSENNSSLDIVVEDDVLRGDELPLFDETQLIEPPLTL